MDETDMMRIAEGRYINFFTDNGKYDIFIIINEPNDINDKNGKDAAKTIDMIDELLRDKIDKMSDEEIESFLEPVFEYGVQIIRKERKA